MTYRSGPIGSADEPMAFAGSARELLDAVPDLVYAFDSDRRFRWWNERVSSVTGYTDEEITDLDPLELIAERDRPAVIDGIETVFDEGRIATRTAHLRTKEGTEIPYEFDGAPIETDDGSIVGLTGIGRDISDRVEMKSEARENRERFQLLVEEVTDYAIFLLSPSGEVTSWNQGAERIKGYAESEILGEHVSIFYPAEQLERGRPEKLLSRAREEGRVTDEGWRVRKDGSRFWASVVITALYDESELQGFAKITRDVTERRERERQLARQRDELETLNRINQVIRGIDRVLVRASNRPEIHQAVADRLASADAYASAWVGSYDRATDRLLPDAWADIDEERVEEIAAAVEDVETNTGPTGRAVRTGEIAISQQVFEDPNLDEWESIAATLGVRSLAAFPLSFGEWCYGVAVVHSSDSHAFEERERVALAELGETVGHAIKALERKRALVSDAGTELEFSITDPSHPFVAATAATDVTIELEGTVPEQQDSFLVYATITGGEPEVVFDVVDDSPGLKGGHVVHRTSRRARCEFSVTGPSIVATLADHGATVTDMTFTDGTGTVVAELPGTDQVRSVVEAFTDAFPDSSLVAQRSVNGTDGPTNAADRSVADLTEKQLGAVRAAYHAGYFDRPRSSTGEEIADSLDVTPSTFHQHLRVGLSKLLGGVLDDESDGSPDT